MSETQTETTTPEHRVALAGWYKGGEVVFTNTTAVALASIIEVVKFDDGKKLDVTYCLYRMFKIGDKWELSHDASVIVQTDGTLDEMMEHIDQILDMVNKGLK